MALERELETFRRELPGLLAKPENREKITAYFAAHGYERLERYAAHDAVNYYFAPRAGAK